MDKLHYYLNTGLKCTTTFQGMPLKKILDVYLMLNIQSRDTEYKPNMRPLSSLTKPITVEGYLLDTAFVPLYLLFSCLPSHNYVGFETENAILSFQVDDGWNHCMVMKDVDNQELCFAFDSNTKSFSLMIDDEVQILSNQLELFELLFRWHFWIGDQTLFGKSLIEIKD